MKKMLVAVALVSGCLLPAAGATSASAADLGGASLASAQDDKKPKQAKKAKPRPGNAKGGNPPAHSNGKGRAQAPGQLKKGTGAVPGDGTGQGAGSDNANPRSENENKKITYCHVPPGNPENGHAITTSVNAIKGHTNHSGDIIPPFSYVKHGKTVSFPGQNWGPDAQAIIDAGCKDLDTDGEPGGNPEDPAGSADGSADGSATDDPEVKGVSLDAASAEADRNIVDSILPDTGGGRLALLLAGLALLAGGGMLLARRRATA